jgi:hypothetical protein
LPHGYRWQTIDLAAGAGAPLDIELAPLPGVPAMAALAGPDGEPFAGREALVAVPFGAVLQHALISLGTTGPAGELDVSRLPPGRHVLHLREAAAPVPAAGQVELIADHEPRHETVEIEVRESGDGAVALGPVGRSRS